MVVNSRTKMMGLALAVILGATGCSNGLGGKIAETKEDDSDPPSSRSTLSVSEIATSRLDRPDTTRRSTQSRATQETPAYNGPTVASVTPERRNYVLGYQQANRDTVGWLVVPGTKIDHYILQNPYALGNDYYLTHDFYGNANRDGTFCADRRIDFGDGTRGALPRNITLYGHNWDDNPNGSLFNQLISYRDSTFAQNNPYIYFSTDKENMAWEVFAVLETTVEMPYVQPDLPMSIYSEVLNVVYAASFYDYGVRITEEDRILTLSTCVYDVQGHSLPHNVENDYRFVVMARLVSPDEPLKERAGFTVNPSPLAPDNNPTVVAPGYQYDLT